VSRDLWWVEDDEHPEPASAPDAAAMMSEVDKARVSELVDFLQRELLKLSPSTDEDDFAEFIAEGRKMLAISSSCVARGADADHVADAVWRSVGALLAEGEPDSGVLVRDLITP